jgi:hypothetical protein
MNASASKRDTCKINNGRFMLLCPDFCSDSIWTFSFLSRIRNTRRVLKVYIRGMDREDAVQGLFEEARCTLSELQQQISNTSPSGAFAALPSVLMLKHSHRQICESVESMRLETQAAKGALDGWSLRLENLMYEKGHYQREIKECRAYREQMESVEEGLELVSEDDYRRYAEAKNRSVGGDASGPSSKDQSGEEGEAASEMEVDHEAVEIGDNGDNGDNDGNGDNGDNDGNGDNGDNDGNDGNGKCEEADEGHLFKLGRLHHEVSCRQQTLEELATLKAERDSVAADIAKRHTILNEIAAEVGRLKEHVQSKLIGFEGHEMGVDQGGGAFLMNIHAKEFVMADHDE